MMVAYPEIFKPKNTNMKPAIRRHTADSRTGRSMISPGIEHRSWAIPKEIADHNAEVDRKKREKEYAKLRARAAALTKPYDDALDWI